MAHEKGTLSEMTNGEQFANKQVMAQQRLIANTFANPFLFQSFLCLFKSL